MTPMRDALPSASPIEPSAGPAHDVAGRVVRATTGSRLHFGMFSFGRDDIPAFGGVGVMLDRPRWRLSVSSSREFAVRGVSAERAREVAGRACARLGLATPPGVTIDIEDGPPRHVGLGSGTQLGLAVAAALRAWLGATPAPPAELAALAGRAERSAVGTYGFAHGGMIVEAGRRPGEPFSPLVARAALPAEWRVALLRPREGAGLSGPGERSAFAALAPVPRKTTDRLASAALLELLPAARTGDYARFGESIYRFGRLAGECFASAQGGAFASPQIAALVERIRQWGVSGVGQSSWGPTVFALCQDAHHAAALLQASQRWPGGPWLATTAAIENRPARIETDGDQDAAGGR